jgi:hypothetical protein
VYPPAGAALTIENTFYESSFPYTDLGRHRCLANSRWDATGLFFVYNRSLFPLYRFGQASVPSKQQMGRNATGWLLVSSGQKHTCAISLPAHELLWFRV